MVLAVAATDPTAGARPRRRPGRAGFPLRVLGIDPGSRFCGFGVVEDKGGARVLHLAHGVLVLDEALPIESRLCLLFDGLRALVALHRPEVVAIEDIFHAQNTRSALVLGEARGVALLVAAQAGATVHSFPPSTVKQAVTGSGRAEKAQVGRMVDALLGIRVTGRADASDALAVALCGVLRSRRPAVSVAAGSGRETANATLQRLIAEAKSGKGGAQGRGFGPARRRAARGKGQG